MASIAFRELFERAAKIAGRNFPTEEVAHESLDAFRSMLLHESTPVDSVMKRIFGRATVREVTEQGGEKAFKVFLHSEPAVESIAPVVRGMRTGDLGLVARTLGIAPTELGTRGFRKTYLNFARDVFPDARAAEELVAAKRALPSSLAKSTAKLRPETYEQLLRAMERDRELKKLITRLSEHIGKNGGTKFRYVSTFFSLSGVAGTVAAVSLAIHEQAKRMAGCWRIYLDPVTKELRSCKILQASCVNKETNESAVCDRTPISFNADMCRDAGPGDQCVHCDPSAEPGSKQHIAPSQYLDADDVYVCKPVASVGEMLGKLLADIPDVARDVAIDVVGTVSRLWNSVKYVLLAAVGVFLVLFAIHAFTKFKRVVDDEIAVEKSGGSGDDETDTRKDGHIGFQTTGVGNEHVGHRR